MGGVIVADELCTGSRYFWDLVAEDSNPLINLADRYLSHSPCARMRPLNHRFDHITNLVQECKIDGAISQSLKFCDIYAHSKPRLEEQLTELGIPVLDLDLEYDLSGMGQLRTRVQSFLEMIEGRRK
jgi:benzoyl-CoA reductase/2-hydroxyglutaryl-CoA dehydratase subunit BcrC/BadD/HgdB